MTNKTKRGAIRRGVAHGGEEKETDMIRVLIAIALVTAVAIWAAGCEIESAWTDEDEDALVYVCVPWQGNKAHCGTGFFVAPDKVATAYHVVDDWTPAKPWLLYHGAGKRELLGDVASVEVNTHYDVAILTLATYESDVWFDLCPRAADIGDAVIIAGYDSTELELTEGHVLRTRQNGRWLRVSAPSSPGRSGAPILDADNMCIAGLVKAGIMKTFSTEYDSAGPGVNEISATLYGAAPGAGPSDLTYVVK